MLVFPVPLLAGENPRSKSSFVLDVSLSVMAWPQVCLAHLFCLGLVLSLTCLRKCLWVFVALEDFTDIKGRCMISALKDQYEISTLFWR